MIKVNKLTKSIDENELFNLKNELKTLIKISEGNIIL